MQSLPFLCLLFAVLTGNTNAADAQVFRYPARDVTSARILRADNRLCVVLRTKRDTVTYLLLDSSFHLLARIDDRWKEPSNLFLAERAKLLGSPFYTDSAFHVYFTIAPGRVPDRLLEKTIDFGRRTITEEQHLVPSDKEVVLGFVQDDENRLHVIAARSWLRKMDLYTLGEGDAPKRTVVDIHQINDANNYFGFVHYIPGNETQQIDNTTARTLAYMRGNQVVLFTHHADMPLQLAVINVATGQVHYKELLTPADTAVLPYFNIASTVSGDKIFQLRAYRDKLELSVYHIPDLTALKQLSWPISGAPLFAAAPRTYDLGGFKREEDTTYPWPQYLADLGRGPLGIAVDTTNTGDFLLTIGTYVDLGDRNAYDHPKFHIGEYASSAIPEKNPGDAPITGVGLGAVMVVGEALANRHAVSLDPGRFHFNAGIAKILLDGRTLANIPGTDLPLGDTHLSYFLQPGAAACSFVLGGRYFRGDYEKEAGAYIIREIPR